MIARTLASRLPGLQAIAAGFRSIADLIAPVRPPLAPDPHLPPPDRGLPAYQLLRDLPGIPAGTVFLHDRTDTQNGTVLSGSLKNAWDNRTCQATHSAGTHALPGTLRDNETWFKRIRNTGRYTA